MRISSVLISATLCVPAMATAQPPPVPARCQPVSTVPPDAQINRPAMAARIAVANCDAESKFMTLQLTPDDASMRALEAAAQPSLQTLDEIIQSGDPEFAPLAKHARADIYTSMAVRMRNAIPPITMGTARATQRAHEDMETRIQPWLQQAQQ